uniref:NADH-ubiquinone oxidoreductase chain 2 n=1 Tax=Acanthocepola krusensternii TaxID=270597 RepID=A0A1V1FH93_9TELE|nr:NADH dehydrogenase subunit 2 [Acanthocepola krusensternii]BAX03657.1 NADH dehydrogenase subunit 2 [Acanthocepola krusensternii]BBU26022.1 NADH dehydrogenase subunit 2 [Acanthocepola krusensternii]
MLPPIMALFLFGLGLGTLITFSSSHWLLAWIGLEINTFSILPIMAASHHPRAVEATTKYFLIQAMAAALLLAAGVTNAWSSGQWTFSLMEDPLSLLLTTMALSLKLGLAPFHLWVPDVLQGLEFSTGMILSTWQKLAPLALFLQIQPVDPRITISIGLASIIIGGWGGLDQTQTRKILAYSSIAHMGWIVLILHFSTSLACFTFFLYVFMTLSAFTILDFNKAINMNILAISQKNSPVISATAVLVLLSMAGLPPLTGFAPKAMILYELSINNLPLIALVAALSALLNMFFYLRLTYIVALSLSPSTILACAPWRLPSSKFKTYSAMACIITLAFLPLTPDIMAIFLP